MKIIIPGQPISKSRHRCSCRGGRAVVFDPQIKIDMAPIRAYIRAAFIQKLSSKDKEIELEAISVAQAESFDVAYTFLFPVSDRSSRSLQMAKLWGFQQHNLKPDLDNLEKFYYDCMTGVIWNDDCQVTVSSSKKVYDEFPRTEIDVVAKKDFSISVSSERVLMAFTPSRFKEFLTDVQAFQAWPPSRIDALVPSSEEPHKRDIISELTLLVNNFALKYSDDLRKIKKVASYE